MLARYLPHVPVAGRLVLAPVQAGPDAADPYSRHRPLAPLSAFPAQLRLGVPRAGVKGSYDRRAALGLYRNHLRPLGADPPKHFQFLERFPHADDAGAAAGGV